MDLEPPQIWLKSLKQSWLRSPYSTEVRDQGLSNTCYAFAMADSMYAHQSLCHCLPYRVSEKDFMDHLHLKYPPPGLQYDSLGNPIVGKAGIGNSFRNAFTYAINAGVLLEKDYPFHDVLEVKKWKDRPKGVKVFLSDANVLPANEEFQIKQELMKQPVVGGLICAPSFKNWTPKKGVYKGLTEEEKEFHAITKFECHALLIVGFGTENGIDYYYFGKNQ